MTKTNPLFVDSTKFHGDWITTQIELNNVLLYDGEVLIVMITNHLDQTDRILMKPMNEESYEARALLNHQKPITYRFVIESNGRRIFQSEIFHSRGQHAIVENWEPCFEEEQVEDHTSNFFGDGEFPPPLERMDPASLIEKWGL